MALCSTLALAATPAQADYLTGADLLSRCSSTDAAAVAGCNGYLLGIMDFAMRGQNNGAPRQICPPEPFQVDALRHMVSETLRDTPALQSDGATKAVVGIMLKTFPCSELFR